MFRWKRPDAVLRVIGPVSALLLSASLLLAGSGLQGTLVAVRANIEGIGLTGVGLLMSAYYVGFVIGCLKIPSFVSRVGHIRTFSTLAALVGAAALLYPFHVDITVWLLLRVVTGFSFAGLYMVLESWINEKSDSRSRGKILAVYRMVDLAAVTTGQFLLNAATPSGAELFSLIGILTCLAILPIAMTRAIAPDPLAQAEFRLSKLIKVSPLAVAGAFAVGAANGAVWAVGPVYVQSLGYSLTMIPVFMSAIVIGGVIGQWPLGLLSDLFDRRAVLIWTAGAACISSAFMAAFAGGSLLLMLAGGAVFGLCAMSIFGLSAAHANDHAEPGEFVGVSSGLLLVFGIGSVFGPVLAPILMNALAPYALFLHTLLVYIMLFAFGLSRVVLSNRVPLVDQADYVAIQPTSPSVFEIDPRSDETD